MEKGSNVPDPCAGSCLGIYINLLDETQRQVSRTVQFVYSEELRMREKRRTLILVGILSLSFVFAGLMNGTVFAGEDSKNAHWTQKHIKKVPLIMMYEPYFSELFGQTDRDVPYNYEEAVKLAGHSCGAVASAWEITRKALKVLYADQTPVRGDIKVYAPGAEAEWNIGVIGEVITYITGAAPHTGFSGSEFASGDQVYVRRDKMVYKAAPVGTMPPNRMIWKFQRLDTNAEVCLRFKYVDFPLWGDVGIQPAATPAWQALGTKLASGLATPEEEAAYIKYWNDRTQYVFDNVDSLVVVTECPVTP